MEQGNRVIATCTDLTHQGEGVCRIDGFLVFVPGLLEDEKAEIEITKVYKSYGYGKILKIIQNSKNRIKPICSNFGKCGGCELLHLDYKSQLNYKIKMATSTFKRIGHLENVVIENIIDMDEPYYYRNKVQIPFANYKGKVICGFYKQKTHEVISLNECFIQPKEATKIALFIKDLANKYNITAYDEKTKKGSLRHLLIRETASKEMMIVLITKDDFKNKELLVNEITANFKEVKSIIQNFNKKDSNVILGEYYKVLYGKETLEENLCGLKFNLSHQSFFQTNHLQTEKLYNKVLEFAAIKKTDIVLDAYCGVGTISLLLAKQAKKLYGIEIVEEAIKNAKQNALLNNIKNTEFIVGKSEDEIIKLKNIKFDVIVVDPPRKGLDKKFIDALIEVSAPKIVYVSCDVATLARDLEILNQKYSITKVVLVDMFPHTCNVECVVCLERRYTILG